MLATTAMVIGIITFAFRLIFSPLVTTFIFYNQIGSSASAISLSARLAIVSGLGIAIDLIAGAVALILGFISLNRGRYLPPPLAQRDQSLIGIVLGFVLLSGVGSALLSTLYPIIFSVFR